TLIRINPIEVANMFSINEVTYETTRLSQSLLIYFFLVLVEDHFANQGNNKCLPEGVLEDSQQLVVINKQRKGHSSFNMINCLSLTQERFQKAKIYGHEKRINMTGIVHNYMYFYGDQIPQPELARKG
ncbi:hypothetical protein ACJX0J_026442, partial [Zea mays]